MWRSGSMSATITHCCFRAGRSQELDYRDLVTTQTDLVASLLAASTSVDPVLLRHVHLSIPRRAQTCLDMHSCRLEHLHF
ncbi:hypothetical protein TNCV_1523071 [Trichonephila clavipes]|nr:hypothetical protein TNCV_1523071 [Trichonephila clavipes]